MTDDDNLTSTEHARPALCTMQQQSRKLMAEDRKFTILNLQTRLAYTRLHSGSNECCDSRVFANVILGPE